LIKIRIAGNCMNGEMESIERREKQPEPKKTTYYNSLVYVCGKIIDKSAGIACNQAGDIVSAIKKAKWDIFKAISCTDMKRENVDNIHKEEVKQFITKRSRSRYTKS